MAFHIDISQGVEDYLGHKDRNLAPQDLAKILTFLEELAVTGDAYRTEPTRRMGAGSPNFKVTFVFEDANGNYRSFRFIVSDAAASYGVLRVSYADEI
jgi:hypothetical protein